MTGYRIDRRRPDVDGDRLTTVVADTDSTATTFLHTAVTDGTKYLYRIAAINTNGAGGRSNKAVITWVAPEEPEETVEPEKTEETGDEQLEEDGRTWSMALGFGCKYVEFVDPTTGCDMTTLVSITANIVDATNDDDADTVDYVMRLDLTDDDGNAGDDCEGDQMGSEVAIKTVTDNHVVLGAKTDHIDCEPGWYDIHLQVREGNSTEWETMTSGERLWPRDMEDDEDETSQDEGDGSKDYGNDGGGSGTTEDKQGEDELVFARWITAACGLQ